MKRPLQELLSTDPNKLADTDMEDEEMPDQPTPPTPSAVDNSGLCVECGDQPSDLTCDNCSEDFCEVCFDYIHRTGNRKLHKTAALQRKVPKNQTQAIENDNVNQAVDSIEHDDDEEEDKQEQEEENDERKIADVANSLIDTRGEGNHDQTVLLKKIKEHARFIPMRLTHEERKYLRLLMAALNVSEYTDKIDILSFGSKAKRMIAQLKEMCSILSGLVVATNMREGQTLMQDKDFVSNAEWFKSVFEIGRRYKIMNPERMRDSFGKLMYMIMDSRLPEVKEAMEFDLYKPIKTVYSYLEHRQALSVLDDPLILQATTEIIAEGKSRHKIQREIRNKEWAIESLAKRHSSSSIDKEDIRQCLYSIGDYHAYLRANCHPIEQILKMLDEYFDPDTVDSQFALSISYGKGGARLSHDHSKQFYYVKQSLTLWSQIMKDMFMLWTLADRDLTSEKRYNLADTGQGLNRIKESPFVSRAMHGILRKAQERAKRWIGSSVIHLGDRAVPNSLFFLTKYVLVPQILTPVYLVISNLDEKAKDPYVLDWINSQYNSVDDLKKHILCDFFKHAFDGSGADNFYDAGSCIDGRLTSAWNWCNMIHKKPFYNKFLVTGFTGFDGTEGF